MEKSKYEKALLITGALFIGLVIGIVLTSALWRAKVADAYPWYGHEDDYCVAMPPVEAQDDAEEWRLKFEAERAEKLIALDNMWATQKDRDRHFAKELEHAEKLHECTTRLDAVAEKEQALYRCEADRDQWLNTAMMCMRNADDQ